jgi:hypothetical protein
VCKNTEVFEICKFANKEIRIEETKEKEAIAKERSNEKKKTKGRSITPTREVCA